MRVFISWSGDRSKAVADVLRRWFPSVIQAVRPYFSPDDVAKGARWSSEIAKELEASRVGLLVITPENQEAPWLLFEAGALAKNLDRSKVCPILFGAMEPTDVKGPLVQFQAAQFSETEMKRVVKDDECRTWRRSLTRRCSRERFRDVVARTERERREGVGGW